MSAARQYLYMAHFTAHPCASLTLDPAPSSPSSSPPDALEPLPAPILAALRALPSVRAAPPTSPIAAALLAHAPPDLPAVPPADAPPPQQQHPRLTPAQAVGAARAALHAWHAQKSLAFEALIGTMEWWDKRKPLEGVLALVLGAADGDEGEGTGTGTGTRAGDLMRVVDRLGGLVLCVFVFLSLDPRARPSERCASTRLDAKLAGGTQD